MKYGVSLSIDLNKLDKSKFKQVTKKDGSVANYLNLTTYITPSDRDWETSTSFGVSPVPNISPPSVLPPVKLLV